MADLSRVAFGFLMLVAVFSNASCTSAVKPATATVTPPVATTTPTMMPSPTSTPTPVPTSTPSPTLLPTTIPTATPSATRAAASQLIQYAIMCPSQNDQARQAYNDGQAFESQGNLEQAKAAYTNAIQFDANYCDAMDQLARLLRKEGKLDDALSLYKRSLSLSPNNIVAHQNLAGIYLRQGKMQDAIAEYRQAVQIAPDDPEGYFGLGTVYLNAQQPEQAITQLEKAKDLYAAQSSPLIADAHYYLGVAYFTSRQFAKARDYFELVSAQRQDDASFNYYLGLCYLSPEVNDRERAKKYLVKAQELGITLSAQVRQSLANETAVPTRTPTPNPEQTATPTGALPLPTGQPVSSWNGIPIMPQAISGSEDKGVYSYTVKATVQQVQDFYDKELAKIGWQPFAEGTGQTGAKILMYQKAGKTFSALIVDQGEIVVVMLVLT